MKPYTIRFYTRQHGPVVVKVESDDDEDAVRSAWAIFIKQYPKSSYTRYEILYRNGKI